MYAARAPRDSTLWMEDTAPFEVLSPLEHRPGSRVAWFVLYTSHTMISVVENTAGLLC